MSMSKGIYKHNKKQLKILKKYSGKYGFQKGHLKFGGKDLQRGEKCIFWKGGISFEPYSVDWTDDLRRAIRKRDKYTCQVCGKEPAIIVHHIDYNKKNCNSDNLITLCRKCHAKTNYDRDYWINFLKSFHNRE